MEKNYKRLVWIYEGLWPLVTPLFRWIFRFKPTLIQPLPTPFLLLSNHNMDFDPILVGCSVRRHMYFVASEHVFRGGLASKVLRYLFDPISRIKGYTDSSAALKALRALKRGHNVCIFAEGSCSFSGRTGKMYSATAKMAKASSASLVTYRLEGGYLTNPRWSRTFRRGAMRGSPVNVYAPGQLAEMSEAELDAAISADLYEDAFERQRIERIRFRGKRLAERLETALFICPQCKRIGRLHSQNDRFFCECGLSVTLDEYGFFQGGPFPTIAEWDDWQAEQVEQIVATHAQDAPFFENDVGTLLEVHTSEHRTKAIADGKILLYPDRLAIGETTIPLADIQSLALVGRNRIVFTAGATHYEFGAQDGFCGRKYLLFCSHLGCSIG